MDAELVRVENHEAVFRKPSGLHYRFEIAQLSQADQDYIKTAQLTEESTRSTAPAPTDTLPETDLTQWLERRLVQRDGTRVKRARESHLPQAEYIAFYYSAHWCPPCRKFTPNLVDFYNEHRDSSDNFELIFVSSDRNEEAQKNYMLEYQMPWPALEFDDVKDSTVTQFAGKGIPCLVIVDREGKVIEHTYVNGEYKGPTRVMRRLGELIAQ